MKSATLNQARIDFRTTSEIKTLIERAAALQGMTVSDFATTVLLERSQEVVQASETRRLTDRDRDIFLSLLDSPAEPNETLSEAAARFRTAVQNRDVIV